MIAVDTSALMAVLLDEAAAPRCIDALCGADTLLISAGTLAEALIVARRRKLGVEMERLAGDLGFEVVDVTPAAARRIAAAYAHWGKGSHRAALNFGDCFAYALAKERDCPLLYVGDEFSATDIQGAL